MEIRITCINKDNGDHYDPHEGITHLGWINELNNSTGKNTRLEIIRFIEDGGFAYTKDSIGRKAYLVVRISSSGNKYVKTVSDGRESNNLLALVECK